MKRKRLLVFLILLAVGCAGKVEVKGVESKTLMNGKQVYYAHTNHGVREVTEGVYTSLVYKLNSLVTGKKLICDMEKGGRGVWDMAICFQGIVVVSEIDTAQDVGEYNGSD